MLVIKGYQTKFKYTLFICEPYPNFIEAYWFEVSLHLIKTNIDYICWICEFLLDWNFIFLSSTTLP